MPRKSARRKLSKVLDIGKLMREFQEGEESQSLRQGSFKTDAPFERALKEIVKAKLQKDPPAKRKLSHR